MIGGRPCRYRCRDDKSSGSKIPDEPPIERQKIQTVTTDNINHWLDTVIPAPSKTTVYPSQKPITSSSLLLSRPRASRRRTSLPALQPVNGSQLPPLHPPQPSRMQKTTLKRKISDDFDKSGGEPVRGRIHDTVRSNEEMTPRQAGTPCKGARENISF